MNPNKGGVDERNNNENGEDGGISNNDDTGEGSADNVNLDAVRRHFKEFLSESFVRFLLVLRRNKKFETFLFQT